jgi:Protein of unknown function (DUF2778)
MNTYQQSTGRFTDADENLVGVGYSGNGQGLNNPEMQAVAMHGPLPQGDYEIGTAFTDPKLGRLAMPLAPCEGQHLFGRSGFFIHGDNQAMNHTASEGCIILSHIARGAIAVSDDRKVRVIA